MLQLFTAAVGPDLWPLPKAGTCCSLLPPLWQKVNRAPHAHPVQGDAGSKEEVHPGFSPPGAGTQLCGTAGGDADSQAAVLCLVLRQGLLPCPSPVPCHGAAAAPLELGRIHTSHQTVPFQISRNYSRNVRSDQIQLWFLGAEKKAFGKGQTLYFGIFCFEKLNSVQFYLKQVELAIQPLKL